VKPKTQLHITRIDAVNFPAHTRRMAKTLGQNVKQTGSFYYHCDWHASHYVKVMLDHIFGENNLQIQTQGNL